MLLPTCIWRMIRLQYVPCFLLLWAIITNGHICLKRPSEYFSKSYYIFTNIMCLCLCPSILLTRASSGSALGSTPNSKSLAPRPMEPPSPARMGEESRASARLGPGGTVTRWEPVPSFPFRVFMKAVSFSVFNSWRNIWRQRARAIKS